MKNVNEQNAELSFQNLIPKPVLANRATGFYHIKQKETIFLSANDPVLLRLADNLKQLLRPVAMCTVSISAGVRQQSGIHFNLVNDSSFKAEGYEIIITDSSVYVNAYQPAGIFYAIQTIRQLLPAVNETKQTVNEEWLLAAGTIKDFPQYAIRGSMLDVARHFFDVEDVKRYVDFLSAYKMNTFHLHLSDDQGWRIEIKKWPKLTEIGGSTEVGGGKGGFYTQEQYKEIVQYAADRFITVIPEIDMPGHTNAALASYPELNCNPKDPNPKLYTGTDVGFSTLCTTNEKVYAFIDNVFAELAAITPGPYIHIGGDESLVTPKEEYMQFINRVQGIVKKYNKQVIGWDEIAHATLQPNTIAQYWSDSSNPVKAVQQGASIIMSPAKRVYMDMQYDSTTKLGLNRASYIELDQAYNWNPATLVNGITQKDIKGMIAPLWTETIVTMKDIEYMVFPRLPGYAEIAWSPAANRNWEEYKNRLAFHGAYLNAKGINFYKSSLINWKE
ncbi:MAG: beta-N-acetylhexosaminidase [Chitinophagaceae bacterium]|nr:beta-N-acetylhexosaminidase [Chitinophagaceae bacterium]